jgi:hypothetical protein
MNAKHATFVLLVPTLALALGGCRLKKDDTDEPGGGTEDVSSDEQALVSDGNDIQESSSMASDLSAIPSIALTAKLAPEDAATAQEEAPTFFQPEGCLTVERAGLTVTYTFAGCTGPWGLIELNGQEIANFAAGEEEGSIAVTLDSKDLTANGNAVDHHADVLVSFPDEGGKKVVWKGGYTSSTKKGLPVTHTSDLVFTVDGDACRSVNGTTNGTVGDRGLTVTYDELSRCGGWTCPSGSIDLESARGLTSSVDFDGTATAIVTGPRGREWEVPLFCKEM